MDIVLEQCFAAGIIIQGEQVTSQVPLVKSTIQTETDLTRGAQYKWNGGSCFPLEVKSRVVASGYGILVSRDDGNG
jgi:hypothetical protein